MKVQELISKSPIRVFEDAIDGGLGAGNLGVLTSRHGVGKTACLVHLAIDKILRGESIVHVSFGTNVEHVTTWYNEVFREISEGKSVDDAVSVYEKIRANRVMMSFAQGDEGVDKILAGLDALLKTGSFKANTVLLDGYKLTLASEDDVKKIKKFAQDNNVEVWFSVSPVRKDVVYNEYGVANTIDPYIPMIDVLVGLHYNGDASRVIITVVKDHGKSLPRPTGVALDPKTMLIAD